MEVYLTVYLYIVFEYLGAHFAAHSPSLRSENSSQDMGVNPFFDELFRHWHVRLRPGVTTIPIDVPDSDDECSDFTDFMVVKEDPYGPVDSPLAVQESVAKSEPSNPDQPSCSAPNVKAEVVTIDPSPVKTAASAPAPLIAKLESMSPEEMASRIQQLRLFVCRW